MKQRKRWLRTFPHLRRFLVYSGISSAVGVLVLLLMEVGRPGWFSARLILLGVVLGFLLNLGASLAEGIVFATLRVDRSWPRAARATLGALTHFAGGIGGYRIAAGLARRTGEPVEGFQHVASSAPVFGLLTALVGITFHALRALNRQLAEQVDRIKSQRYAERELETARSVQERLLPPQQVSGSAFEVHARNLPARTVAGDLYDVFRLEDGDLGLAVGDVAGKGMGASLHMVSVKAMLPLIAAELDAAQTLRELNRRLLPELGPREFVALSFARYRPATGTLEIANAGLPDPYLLGDEVRPIEVPGERLPLGVREDVPYSSTTVRIAPGEGLLMISDGLPEAIRKTGVPLGYEAFERVLRQVSAESVSDSAQWLDAVIERVREVTEATQEDDWTALLLERQLQRVRRAV